MKKLLLAFLIFLLTAYSYSQHNQPTPIGEAAAVNLAPINLTQLR